MTEHITSFWLVPAAGHTDRYRRVIDALASEQGGVPFQPHLTLGSFDQPAGLPDEVRDQLREITLIPMDIDATPVFTKSLFVRFASHPSLTNAREMLTKQPGFSERRSFDPHISLCYGTPPTGARLRDDVRGLLNAPVTFDAIWAVDVSVPVETHDDVANWRVLDRFDL